jgi:guanylate cyclase
VDTELALPEIERWSMRFRDRAIEAAFWRETAPERAQQGARTVRPLILVVVPAFIAFFATRDTWPDRARWLATGAMGVFWLTSVGLALWARTQHFVRHVVAAYVAFFLANGAMFNVAVAVAPPSFAPYGLALTVIMLLRIFQGVSTLSVLTLLAIGVAYAAAYLVLLALRDGEVLGHGVTLAAALATATPRMRENHLVVRREYAYRRLSDQLVDAMLPRPIAMRLKAGERTIADRHEHVSVLFADLVGFTSLTQRIDPGELAALLDRVFTRFDALATTIGVEKIKTIGDCYMAAVGMPDPCDDHAARAARMALGMREIIDDVNRETGHALQLRVGLDTGPVIAGVLGRNKLLYDLWGDTVNTAARMESHGEPSALHVSDAFQRALGPRARTRDRGTIEVKGKGPMRTWFLDGLDQG